MSEYKLGCFFFTLKRQWAVLWASKSFKSQLTAHWEGEGAERRGEKERAWDKSKPKGPSRPAAAE